jgi:hypothetical protein
MEGHRKITKYAELNVIKEQIEIMVRPYDFKYNQT